MSDFKPAVKQEVKQKPLPQSSLATSMNAWGTPVSDGQGHSLSWKQPPLEEEFQSPSISPSKNESLPKDRPVLEQQQHIVGPDLEQPPVEPDVSVEMDARYDFYVLHEQLIFLLHSQKEKEVGYWSSR